MVYYVSNSLVAARLSWTTSNILDLADSFCSSRAPLLRLTYHHSLPRGDTNEPGHEKVSTGSPAMFAARGHRKLARNIFRNAIDVAPVWAGLEVRGF
jgi:hypothetical protein